MSPITLITGAAGGLGQAVVARFADIGHTIVAVDLNSDALAACADRHRAGPGGIHVMPADLTDPGAIVDLGDRVHREVGAVDNLLNIAGYLHRGAMADTDVDTWGRTLDVNVTAPFLLTKAFRDDLRTTPRGRIVNCSSISATVGYPLPAYAASKAALSSLTRSLLFDFWGTNTTVNAVAPGAMRTPMVDIANEDKMVAKTPAGRIVTPEDVAATIAFLASDDARGINGTTVTIDGGATAIFSYAQP
ncbi:SDR family NAD(P)-dependent oxidoreductase [Gordonia rhizosphera]|uniref:Putative oxidoreductase n=1 Tax=Gordonia rhizosphera NBRC 16068 TaxID=1108045 RepID=K6WBM3_9ACTN|nr:SDR family oxidoreductase [Gordonia rhizosphera]GAB89597.1 putative oxidoreductase [Gordonia rhizosphera NBRC 16068]